MPPASDRRWSGAFRVCACGQRNFVGRKTCTACGASLRSQLPTAPLPPAPWAGRRDADRIQGRGLTLAGGAMALVAIAGGVLVWRSLRAPEWAPLSGEVADSNARPAASPAPDAAAPELPAVARPEDRAVY